MRNLIIVAELSEPPTEGLFFRYLTLVTRSELSTSNLIEAEQEVKDIYYKYLKSKGLFDFVDQIITPQENEFGIRLDTELNYPLTIRAKSITCVNCVNLLGQIKHLSQIV